VIRGSSIALAASLACLPAAALLTRPDRDDAEYLELASRYSSSIPLPAPVGEGVLIAARWVLTAPAPAQLIREIKPTPRMRIGGSDYEIEAIHVSDDLALVLLAKPVRGVAPTPVYPETDEKGKAVAIAGHRSTGRIGAAGRSDGRRRAGINTVDGVTATTLEVLVKSGDDASDLQGVLQPDEAGAGAYIADDDGKIFVAGIARSIDDKREIFTRLSARMAWIESVMLEVAKKEAEKLLGE
jgi:hypothetical protein